METKNTYLFPVKLNNEVKISYSQSPAHVEKLANAVDFIVPQGTPVYASCAGIVVDVKDDSNIGGPDKSFDEAGNFIEIEHDGKEYSIYEHIKKGGSLVKAGEKVSAGQLIGYSGATGWIANLGPHLHFDIHKYIGENPNDYQSLVIRWEIPKKVVLIHGKDTDPNKKWYPWISGELRRMSFEVLVPALPNSQNPILSEWLASIDSAKPDENTILIGHSRGGVAILRWLERLPAGKKVKKVILVGTNSGKKSEDYANGFFSNEGFDFNKIKSHCNEFVVIHSKDDEWVPFEDGEENAKGLGAKFLVFEDKGHFGKKTPQVPEILDEIIGKPLSFDPPHEGAEFRKTVGAVIRRKSDGKFLLVKWKEYGWIAPVIGGVDEGEDLLAAAEREVFEETGLRAKAIMQLGNYTESYFFAQHKNVWRHRHAYHIFMELISETPQGAPDVEYGGREVIWLSAKEALKQITHYDNTIGIRRLLGLADSLDEKELRSL